MDSAGAPLEHQAPDVLNLYEFFETFVAENRVSLYLHDCHREICDMYEAAVLGQMEGYEYFVVNMPRRIGKTKILEALACWMFGEFDEAQMLYGCYSEKLVMRTMAYIQHTLRKDWYRHLYGDKLHGARADLITTLSGGVLYGAGTTATITGFGAGLKEPAGGFEALDDPAKPDEALSKVESAKVIQNFETTWKGCRNSDRWSPIFINAQRLGPDDLPGYVQKTYPNKTFTLKFPCMVAGISAFPETWSTGTLTDLEKTRIGRFVKASQFDQEPIALGGNLIPVDEFLRWDVMEAPSMKFERLVIPVDTALKVKEANDFSAAALWGLLKKRAYLIDLIHGKWESPELLVMIAEFYEKWRHVEGWPVPRLIIEEKAAGTPLLQNLRQKGIPAVGIERDIDKVRRVQNVLPFIETHLVYIPKPSPSLPWLAGWESEHSEFNALMTHAHDDRVDTTADALQMLLGGPVSILDVLGAPQKRYG
jgi:predicted phage terminase large subunit-like protein